jgi:hypothetical protein
VRSRRWLVMALMVTALTVPAAAGAKDDDDVRVSIAGTPQVGATLEASAATKGGDGVAGTYTWRRCKGGSKKSCVAIAGASGTRYTLAADDLDRRIRVRLRLRDGDDENDGDDDDDNKTVVDSPPTKPVAAGPPPPPVILPPVISPPVISPPVISPPLNSPPALEPQPPVTFVTSEVSLPARPTSTARSAPRFMRPAPTVRIAGIVTRLGARVTVLSVRAPRGARISLRCTGDGCPRRALAVATSLTRLRAFERDLAAGTRLEIRVTRAGYVGKHTLIQIRRGKPPSRVDRCLYPGSSAPRRCVS